MGAHEILPRSSVDLNSSRPLEKTLWAGALDSVGGATLAWLTRTMQVEGAIASYGNAGGVELKTTVLPFILRGVKLLGIDSATTAMPLRQKIWQRLATDLRPNKLDLMIQRVPFNQLPQVFTPMLQGQTRGRNVIEIA